MVSNKEKNDFLKTIENKSTESIYKRIIEKLELFCEERVIREDQLDVEDILSFIRNYVKPSTFTSARTQLRMTSKYIENIGGMKLGNDDYNYIVNNSVKQQTFFNKEFLDDLISLLNNHQDIIIPVLLFHGVEGKEGIELRSLKNSNVYDDHIIVEGKNKNIKVEMEEKYIRLVRLAIEQKIYIKKNGEGSSNMMVDSVELVDSPYVMRVAGNRNSEGMANKYSFQNRFNMIRNLESVQALMEEYNLSPIALTAKNVKRSGMIYEYKKLTKDERVEPMKARSLVCDKFRTKETWAIRDFLNNDKVEELYGE